MRGFLKYLFYLILASFFVYIIYASFNHPGLIKINIFLLLNIIATPLLVVFLKKIVDKHKQRMFKTLDAIEYLEKKNNLLTENEILKILFLSDLDYYVKTKISFFLLFWFVNGNLIVSKTTSSHFDSKVRESFKLKNPNYKLSAKEIYPILDKYVFLTGQKIDDNIFDKYPYLQKLRESEKLSLVIFKMVKAQEENG